MTKTIGDINEQAAIDIMVNCTVTVGATTGIESITALGGTGQIERSYVRVFTFNGISYQQKITIAYNPTDSAVISSKAGVPRTFGNSISSSTWTDISTNGVMTVTNCPVNGIVAFSGGIGFGFVSGSNATVNLRLKIDGAVVYTSLAQSVMAGGMMEAFDFSDIFQYVHPTQSSAGTHTFSIEAQRVLGDGVVSTMGNLFATITGT